MMKYFLRIVHGDTLFSFVASFNFISYFIQKNSSSDNTTAVVQTKIVNKKNKSN